MRWWGGSSVGCRGREYVMGGVRCQARTEGRIERRKVGSWGEPGEGASRVLRGGRNRGKRGVRSHRLRPRPKHSAIESSPSSSGTK